jgi:general secretion pathway protein J
MFMLCNLPSLTLPSSKKQLEGRGSIEGFTLLEILIALFIFTIISTIMVTVLHSVLNTQSTVEKSAARFTQLQTAMIIIQNDFEQILDRPISNATGGPEASIMGSATEIKFTHAGFSNPQGELNRSTLQRVYYFLSQNHLIRQTWPVLDPTQDTQVSQRRLLDDVADIRFQYLDANGKFQNGWPVIGQPDSALPRAIRVILTLKKSGKLSQLYIIPGQTFGLQK